MIGSRMLLLFFREFVVSPALETKRSCFHLLTAQYDSPMKRAQRHEEINTNQQTRLAFAAAKEYARPMHFGIQHLSLVDWGKYL